MFRLVTLLAPVAAALTFAGSALAYTQAPPVLDPQPAFVTPDQEGDGRLVGWTTTFCFDWSCHDQRYDIVVLSSPPPPFLGTTQTWNLPVPHPEVEGPFVHHQSWIVHLRAGWSYVVRVRARVWITPIWYPPFTASSEWESQSFAVRVKSPDRTG